jgi:hypothetical protein
MLTGPPSGLGEVRGCKNSSDWVIRPDEIMYFLIVSGGPGIGQLGRVQPVVWYCFNLSGKKRQPVFKDIELCRLPYRASNLNIGDTIELCEQ